MDKYYLVEWYADETGYHASAPHLPGSKSRLSFHGK